MDLIAAICMGGCALSLAIILVLASPFLMLNERARVLRARNSEELCHDPASPHHPIRACYNAGSASVRPSPYADPDPGGFAL